MPNKPKPPSQIDIWRHEVQSSTSTSTPTSTPTVFTEPPSIWRKILGRESGSTSSHPSINAPTSSENSKIKKSKLKEKLRARKGGEDTDGNGSRTEMYDRNLTPVPTPNSTPRPRLREGDRGSSLEVQREEVDDESESEEGGVDDVLRERRARLERAARLLNASNHGHGEEKKEEGIGIGIGSRDGG